jgi:GNAT superfamily N-acetyltransferase
MLDSATPMTPMTLRLLARSDSPAIQPVFDACVDYALMQDGQPFSEQAAALEFGEVPAGWTTASKRIFAIEQEPGLAVGMIEGLCGYPRSDVWFIGLMLVVPAARSAGLGASAIHALERFVRCVDGCTEIELAVLKVNTPALRFWEGRGWAIRRDVPAATFGQRTHERWVLGKRLTGG